MSTRKARSVRAERALREAYRCQPLPSPNEVWYEAVMGQVRRESLAGIMALPQAEIMAWRFAWAAAAAAIVMAVVGLATIPNDAQTVWDLRHLASPYEWSLAMGE